MLWLLLLWLINNYTHEQLFSAFCRYMKQLHFLSVWVQEPCVSVTSCVSPCVTLLLLSTWLTEILQCAAGSITAANSVFPPWLQNFMLHNTKTNRWIVNVLLDNNYKCTEKQRKCCCYHVFGQVWAEFVLVIQPRITSAVVYLAQYLTLLPDIMTLIHSLQIYSKLYFEYCIKYIASICYF